MSTKTSFKRIALVAASALAIGGFSAVTPASAASTATTWTVYDANVTSISLKSATTSPKVGVAVYVNVGAVLSAGTNGGGATTAAVTRLMGAVTAQPDGGFVTTAGSTNVQGATAGTATTPTGSKAPTAATTNITGATGTGSLFLKQDDTAVSISGTVTTSATTGLGSFTFTPTKAGVYTLTVWNDGPAAGATTVGNATPDTAEAKQTISITVAAATTLSPSASFLRIAPAGTAIDDQNVTTVANYTTTVDAVARSASAGIATDRNAIGQVAVVLVNADATAASNLHTLSASVTGSGLISWSETGTAAAGTARAASITLAASKNIGVLAITTDGTAGPGSATISVTDSVSGVTTVIGTKSWTTYGSVAKLAVSSVNYSIGKAGSTTGGASATRVEATEVGTTAGIAAGITPISATVTTPAFIVKATDSTGLAVTTAAVPTIVSSDATVVTGGTCILDTASATYGSSTNGVGTYNCNFSTAAAAKSGSKATLTIRVIDPAGDGTTYLTTTQVVTVGGSVAKEVISFDKASYSTGEAMTITITATDSSGNPVYDGDNSPALSGNKANGGDLNGADIYVGGKASADLFAPAIGGDFTVKGTGTDTAKTAISATAAVEGDASSSLALDAANAATDAANNAYDEAQNATQAASDALAAVTALAAQVKSLIASVKKLTAAVAKLKK